MGTQEKLDALKEKKARLQEQINAMEARQKDKERKEDTRLKVLIGAAMLADARINPSTVEQVRRVLQRGITSERDRAFLESKGWIEASDVKGDGPQG